MALAVAVYALSPIDLIPDFIPVIGYLDDLIIVQLGILLAVRLIPAEILAEHRFAASEAPERSASRTVAIVIVATGSAWRWSHSASRCAISGTGVAQLVWRRPNDTA